MTKVGADEKRSLEHLVDAGSEGRVPGTGFKTRVFRALAKKGLCWVKEAAPKKPFARPGLPTVGLTPLGRYFTLEPHLQLLVFVARTGRRDALAETSRAYARRLAEEGLVTLSGGDGKASLVASITELGRGKVSSFGPVETP